MTTQAATGASAAANFVTDNVRQSTAQLMGAFSQTTKYTFDTIAAVARSLSKFPPSLPVLPLAPTKDSLQQWIDVSFDTTEQLFKLQRELLTEMLQRMPAPRSA